MMIDRPRDENGKFIGNKLSYGGVHTCEMCLVEMPCTPDNFRIINKGKPVQSVSKICRKCKYAKDRLLHQHKMKTDPDYVGAKRARCRNWRARNRAKVALKNYINIDNRKGMICPMTFEEVESLISKPCHYCGDTERVGVDRVDNSLPHTLENGIPCCADCNMCRSDKFTVAEMEIIGAAIRKVKAMR